MGKVTKLGIKNRTCYYFDDIIDIKKLETNLLKIDKKPYKDLDIYYIGCNTIKKFSNCNGDCIYENIFSLNKLYLIIYSTAWYFKEKNGEKYLILDSTEKYEEVFSGTKSEIETINSDEKIYYEKDCAKIGVNTDDDMPLNKQMKFPTLIIIIRCIFQKGKELDPLIYLDECLYEL